MQPAEVRDGEVDERLDLIGVGDVGLLERDRVAELRRQRFAALDVGVGDDDLRALVHEAARPSRDRGRRHRR